MFILRTVSEKGTETNQIVGSIYTFIEEECNPQEFKELLDYMFESSPLEIKESCYGFITDGHAIPLYRSDQNYIMTENGRTFANVSKR